MTDLAKPEFLSEVATYYSAKLVEHGATALGVDWNGEESQTTRFAQLCKMINTPDSFSINDLGCGYGALYDYLAKEYASFLYAGVDVSDGMVQAAEQRYKGNAQVRFILGSLPDQVADFGLASGIFNVRMGNSDNEWRSYLEATLDVLDGTSRLGFAFNCLTSYSDEDKKRDYLYYADPLVVFDFCKRRYSQQVALLHDYGLHEFTILVRKG
jgi:cyclopropane fatty-acyl-phospholipid synthase-like methyltransferase